MKLKIRRPYSYETGQLAVQEQEYTGHTLYHHGILGMKWGKRNGPPYPLRPSDHSAAEQKAGWKKSLAGASPAKAADLSDQELAAYNKRKSLENQYNKLSGQEKSKLERVKDLTDTSANSSRQLKNMMNEGGDQKPEKIRPDLSGKSDKELRDAINRENLERQYTELFGEEKKSKAKAGKEFATKVLRGTTGALTLASLGLSIAVGIKTLAGGSNVSNKLGKSSQLKDTVDKDSKNISKHIANELVNDMERWAKNGDYKIPDSLKGSKKKAISKIASKVKKQLANVKPEYMSEHNDDVFDFVMDGIEEYSDSAPLTIEYSRKQGKVKNIYYT